MSLTKALVTRQAASWAGMAADFGVILSIIVGVWIFFSEQRENESLRRREAALELISLRHQSPYADISQQLTDSLLVEGRIGVFKGSQKQTIESDASKIIAEVGAGKIDSLAMLYSAIVDCTTSGLCDSNINRKIIDSDLVFFYCGTKDYILPEIEKRIQSKDRYRYLYDYAQDKGFDCS